MKKEEIQNSAKNITVEQAILVKSSFYSFLNNYGLYIFSLFTSFLMARLISKELWGFFIIASSYIMIISLILEFLPPALSFSLNYYIPTYIASNQTNQLKYFIRNSIILKIVILIPIFLISLLVFVCFAPVFAINLNTYTNILMILSPLILINGLNSIVESTYRGFHMFKTIFLILLIQYLCKISALFFFLLCIGYIQIELLALISVISSLVPFLISIMIFIPLYIKIKPDNKERDSFKKYILRTTKYGAPISIGIVFNEFWKELQIQAIGSFEYSLMVTGYSISMNYSSLSTKVPESFSLPLITTFSELNRKNEDNQIIQIYNISFKYSLFLILLITGILIFLTDFFLVVAYGESFLIYSLLIKFFLLTAIFKCLGPLLGALISALNKVKYFPIITLIIFLLRVPLFFIGLIYFGIIGAIISLIFSGIMEILFHIYLSLKVGSVKINKRKITLQFLSFFVALILTIVLENVVFSRINQLFLNTLSLQFLETLNIFSLLIFILIFLASNLLFKIFSNQDFELISLYFNKDKKSHKIIRRVLKFAVSKEKKEIK